MTAELVKVGPGRYRAAGAAGAAGAAAPRSSKPPNPERKIGRVPLAQVGVPCVHLGEKIPGQPCGSALYRCNFDGVVCSKVAACRDAARTCTDCDHRRTAAYADREPKYPPPTARHLACHVLPVAGPVWRRNLDNLKRRWSLFDGAKVFSVCTGLDHRGRPLDPVDAVRDYLPADATIIETPNSPETWEAASWPALWGTVLPAATADDAVLYCHAKGVSRPPDSTVHEWTDLLHALCLDHWPTVSRALESSPVAGPMRRLQPFPQSPGLRHGGWYYSGNFWWVRAGEMVRALKRIGHPDPHKWSAEAWVGLAWRPAETAAVGPLSDRKDLSNVYRPEWWAKVARPAVRAWRKANPADGTAAAPATDRPVLYAVTPVTRPGNLPAIAASLEPLRGSVSLRWLTVFSDRSHPDWYGGWERNQVLDAIPADAWVWFCDDDTTAHPRLGEVLARSIAAHPNADGFVFDQVAADGSVRLRARGDAKIGQVDAGSFVLRRSAIGATRFRPGYTADGAFFEDVAGRVVAVPEAVTVYNALRPEAPGS